MGIIRPQKVLVHATGKLFRHLIEQGENVKYRQEVLVDIDCLERGSSVLVKFQCDYCGKIVSRPYKSAYETKKCACEDCKKKCISESKIQSLPPSKQKYHDSQWLYEQYIVCNRTAKDIAVECETYTETIEAYLIKANIRKTYTYDEIKLIITRDKLYDMYVTQHLGINYIASLFEGIGATTIKKLLKDYNIRLRGKNELHVQMWQDESFRNKMSSIRKKLWQDDEYRTKTLVHLKDEDCIRQRAIKCSAHLQGVSQDEWEGFLTPENSLIRGSRQYAEWREKVFQRDDYTCQCCGARSSMGNPVFLQAHHLESFADNKDLRFDVSNGITLCNKCHDPKIDGSFHNMYGSVHNTSDQFEQYLEYRLCCEG